MLRFKSFLKLLCLVNLESFVDFIGTKITTQRRHGVLLILEEGKKRMLSVLNLSLQFNAPVFKNSTSYIFKIISIIYKL